MNKYLLVAFFSILLLSCNGDDDVSPNQINRGKITFTVDGVNYVCDLNQVIIKKEPNTGVNDYSLTIYGTQYKSGTTEPGHTITMAIPDFDISKSNFVFSNYIDLSDENLGNNIGYTIGFTPIYTNVWCDEIIQGNGDYGAPGNLTISSLSKSTKLFSGSFSMELCKSSTEHVDVVGSFQDVEFTLFE